MAEVMCALTESPFGPLSCASVTSKAAHPRPTSHGNNSSSSHHENPNPKESKDHWKTSTKPTKSEHVKGEHTKSEHKRSEPAEREDRNLGKNPFDFPHGFPKPKQSVVKMKTTTIPPKSEPTKNAHTNHGNHTSSAHHENPPKWSMIGKKTSTKPVKSEPTKSEHTKTEHTKSNAITSKPTKKPHMPQIPPFTGSGAQHPPSGHGDTAAKSVVSVSNGMANVGCYTDSTSKRTFNGPSYTNSTGMTVDQCTHHCSYSGYPKYAGLEAGTTCWCAYDNPSYAQKQKDNTLCNMGCSGNSATNCGGKLALQVYESG